MKPILIVLPSSGRGMSLAQNNTSLTSKNKTRGMNVTCRSNVVIAVVGVYSTGYVFC